MIVAITGARGFVGQRLVMAHLTRGDEVRVLARSSKGPVPESCKVFVGDLTVPGSLPLAFADGADVLYNCAAELRDESRMKAVNVAGTRSLLELATSRVRRWVQLSSVGVYGPRRAGEVREDAALSPENTYERTKAEADRLVAGKAGEGAFGHVVLRPSIVFGSDMPNQSLRQLAGMVRRGRFSFIGPPGASANYIPVDNVIDALLLCGTHPSAIGRTYNLSDWVTMEDFIAGIADALGVQRPRRRLPLGPVRAIAKVMEKIPGNPLSVARIDALTGRARYPSCRIETELGYRHRQTIPKTLNAMFRKP